MFFVVLCPGTPEGSTGSGSGFKASQKTGQRRKVSSDRLGEAGNRTCDPWFTRHRFIPFIAINDGQLYILRGHKLYFRKKCILSLTIDFVSANSVDSDQMRIWVSTVCQNTDLGANSR